MKKLFILLAVATICRGPLHAGPVGPVPLNPDQVILNQGSAQNGKTFNVPGATITTLTSNLVKAQSVVVNGVAISTQPFPPAYSIYPATSPITTPGITSTFGTFTGVVNGTTITITGQFNGAQIHGSSCVITGTITGSNVSGANHGDVTLGVGSGLTITGQVLSLATATVVSTGSLTAGDYAVFNAKLAPNGNGSALTGLTKSQVGLSNVANVDQTDADNLTSGTVGTARLAAGSPSSSNFLRGDQNWSAPTSTNVGLGQVLNAAQVKRSDYTQKGGFLVGIGTGGIYSILAPGADGTIVSADSTAPTGLKYIINPTAFTVYPATGIPILPHGFIASSGTITGDLIIFGGLGVVGDGIFGGNLSANNLSGTNTGDVTLSTITPNGLSLAFSQQLNLSTASANQTGALTAADWQRFNTATSTSGISLSNVTITGGTATSFNVVTGTLGSTVIASSVAVNSITPSALASGTYSAITLPAANVAAGSLGASVLASSLAASVPISATQIQSGNLGAAVIVSSVAVGAVQDASIVAVSASKLTGTGTLPNASVDKSSITAQGNSFNAANKLLQLDSSGFVPAANLPTSIAESTGTFGVLTSSSIRVNILSFGGRGDNATDNQSAFNAAVSYAAAVNPFGYATIYFPHGVYKTSGFNIGTNLVSIDGDAGSTVFVPTTTTPSGFMVNITGNGVSDWRYINNILFYSGGGAAHGRGIYVNALGYFSVKGCQFRSLEYGLYSNSTEWIHHEDDYYIGCKYATVLTTKNGDVLGNSPSFAQNSAAQWFHDVHWEQNNISLYIDDPDNSVGDHQAAISLKQCTIAFSTAGVVAVYTKNSTALLYNPLSLDYVWLEQNSHIAGSTQSFNGNVFTNAGLNVAGAEVDLDHIAIISDNMVLSNTARLVGSNVKIDSTGITVSTDVVGYINNCVADDQNGVALSWCHVDNLLSYNSDRPALAMTHHHGNALYSGSYRNKITGATTSSCAYGPLPGSITGSPTISYFYGDGFIGNTSVKITGSSGNSVRWSALNIAPTNYYVTTFAVRTDTAPGLGVSSFTITNPNGTNTLVPHLKVIQVSPNWRTYASIGQPSLVGNASMDFTLASATTIYVSAMQVVEFSSLQEAKEFLNSDTFVLPIGEGNNRTQQLAAPPTTGFWRAGDVVWNSSPSSSTPTGFICVSSGTPGSWANFGTPITVSNLVQATATNDTAPLGFIGEFISTTGPVASTLFTTSGNYGNYVSTGITAGDWLCSANVTVSPNSAGSFGDTLIAISIFSGNTTTDHITGYNVIENNYNTPTGVFPITVPPYRISTATSQTVYLKGRASYVSGNPQFQAGTLTCHRIR